MLRICLLCSFLSIVGLPSYAQVRSFPDKDPAGIVKIERKIPDPKLPIVPVPGFPDKTSLVTNRAKTFKAYVLCVIEKLGDGACIDRVFITNISAGDTLMISDEVIGGRPVNELKWVDNNRLSFERWMNPHFGRRYVVNAKLGKQTAAFVLSDQR